MLRVDHRVGPGIGLPMQHEPSSEAEIEEQGPVEDSVEGEVAGQDGEGEGTCTGGSALHSIGRA